MKNRFFYTILWVIIVFVIILSSIWFQNKGMEIKQEIVKDSEVIKTSFSTHNNNITQEEPQIIENQDTTDNDNTSEITEVPIEEVSTVPEESEIVPEVQVTPVYVPVNSISLTFYQTQLVVGQVTMPFVTMSPYNATNKGEIWTSSDENIATVDRWGNIKGVSKGSCTVTVTSSDNKDVFATVNVTVVPDVEPTYIDGILIVNKTYPLPRSYAPGADPEATNMLWTMFADAKKEGHDLWVGSGYRSYIDQNIIYNNYVARDGKAAADTYSARPGHSEHQSGLAFDLNHIAHNFAYLPEGIWVAENCHKYGFIVRYPKDKQHITGYIYEPWHIRYIGVEKATAVYESGLCLEEFLGITSVYSY